MASLERVSKSGAKETVLVVRVGGEPVGLLTKFRDTRRVRHPWKAYAGVGMASRFLGAFYPEEGEVASAFCIPGQSAALARVLAEMVK